MDNQRKIEQWEKIKSKGFIRFIIESGILKFGLLAVITTQIGLYVIDYGFTLDYVERLLTREHILDVLFVALISGVVFGLIMWIVGENEYRKLIR
jgi:hypothetical protein